MISCKVCYHGDVRHFDFDVSRGFDKFQATVCEQFNTSGPIVLTYVDPDQDVILVSTTEELEEAIRLAYDCEPPLLVMSVGDVRGAPAPAAHPSLPAPQPSSPNGCPDSNSPAPCENAAAAVDQQHLSPSAWEKLMQQLSGSELYHKATDFAKVSKFLREEKDKVLNSSVANAVASRSSHHAQMLVTLARTQAEKAQQWALQEGRQVPELAAWLVALVKHEASEVEASVGRLLSRTQTALQDAAARPVQLAAQVPSYAQALASKTPDYASQAAQAIAAAPAQAAQAIAAAPAKMPSYAQALATQAQQGAQFAQELASKAPGYAHQAVTFAQEQSSAAAASLGWRASAVSHPNTECAMCHQNPIVGARYECTVCPNVQLCAKCEAKDLHDIDHALLKIRRPPPAGQNQAAAAEDESPGRPNGCPFRRAGARPLARYVRDVTFGDGCTIGKGERFTKVWRMRNAGSAAWPTPLSLVHVSGDRLGAARVCMVPAAVAAGSEIDIAVDMVAPEQEGRYVGYWKLAGPDGVKFGHRIWAEVQVVSDCAPPPLHPEEDMADSASGQAQADGDEYAHQLEQLALMGLVDRHRNLLLLRECGGHVEEVVNRQFM